MTNVANVVMSLADVEMICEGDFPSKLLVKYPEHLHGSWLPGLIWQHLSRTGTVVQCIYISDILVEAHEV